jgi:hypothetical protein
MEEIRNKIAESGLIALDLADFKPENNNVLPFDIANFLWEGLVLKEKDFRLEIQNFNWEQFKDANVFIFCSVDAIVPTWAYMLVASKLQGIVNAYVVGSKMDIEKIIIQQNIDKLDLNSDKYQSKKYIIKGCSDITCPEFAMTELMKKIQPSAKSIMYGEPCSTVPIYKFK